MMSNKPQFVGEKRAVALKDACTLIMGQSPSSDSYNVENHGLPFYQGNADFGEKYPTPRSWCTDPKKVAEKDDILISVRAPIGAINIASEQCCIGRGVAAIRPKPNLVEANFLCHQLIASRKRLEAMGTGSTFKAVGKTNLSNFPIALYPKSTQEIIGRQLDRIVEQIKDANNQLVSLDSLVKSRFVEMFGTICEPHYPVVEIERLCSCIVDCPHETPKYEGELIHPAIRTSELKGSSIDWSSMRYVSESEYQQRIKRMKPMPGDIVYAREGTYGDAAILPTGYEFCLGQRTMLFRASADVCMPEYLLHALISPDVKRQADELNVGSTVPHVNVRDAKRFKVMCPNLGIQQEFAAFVAQVDKSRFVAQQQIEKLQMLYDSLAQEYFGD